MSLKKLYPGADYQGKLIHCAGATTLHLARPLLAFCVQQSISTIVINAPFFPVGGIAQVFVEFVFR